MGKGDKEEAVYYIGNAAVMMVLCGTILTVFTEIFLGPLMRFFGSPENVLGYAKEYTGIVAIGFPLLILTAGGGHLIRADGRPQVAMICNIVGAVINTILDAIFVFGLGLGMRGAAFATIIGQMISGLLVIWYLGHCKTIQIKKQHLRIGKDQLKRITSLGAAPCSNQLAMMVVQIVMNKSLKYYGSLSIYGEAIPIACAGIITKVNQVFMSFIIGISQGLQPIVSFNYGARKYQRVKRAYRQAIMSGFVLSIAAFLLFQIAPRQIISIFGNGTEEYYQFAINYFHIFLFFTFVNFLQPITSNFFTAIGKPTVGVFLSLTRQIIFLLPLLVVFPLIFGIDGIMYAGPSADFLAAVVTGAMAVRELKRKEYR